MSPAAAFITTQMLKDVLAYGTAKSLRPFGEAHAAAGKTGTTDGARDAWFVGYTPNLVTGVWVGHDRPRPEGRGFTGGAIAAPIWEQFMKRAVAARPSGDFPRPDTVRVLTVDADTGLPAREGCPAKREAFFASGTEPMEPCPRHEGEPVPEPEVPGEGQGGETVP
jgi:membrane carboxypeptidase/penicillin-binding protein